MLLTVPRYLAAHNNMVEVHKSCRAVHSEADAKVPATPRATACNRLRWSLQPPAVGPATPRGIGPATACGRACNPAWNRAHHPICAQVLFERYSAFLLATLSIEVDRLEQPRMLTAASSQ